MRVAHQSGAFTVPVAILLSIVASIVPLNHSRALAGEYGVHLAYSKPADANDGSSLVGGHVEFAPSPIFGVVGAVDYRSDDVYNTSWGSLRTRSIPVTLTGRFYLPMPTLAFSPFLEGGAGWYRVAYHYSGLLRSQLGFRNQSVSTFGWHLGAGGRLLLSPLLSFVGEARYTFADPERKLNREVRNQIRNLDYSGVYLAVGLGVRF